MNRLLILSLVALYGCTGSEASEMTQTPGDLARRVLSSTPLMDGHNDLAWEIRNYEPAPHDVVAYGLDGRTQGHTDIPRLREGMVGAQFWSVYVPSDAVRSGAAAMQREQIAIAKKIFETHPDVFQETLTSAEVMPAFQSGKIASVIGMEGGHVIENSLDILREYYDLGARYLTLTHSANTDWADASSALPEHDGLTEFGREVVREMNRLGMLVDISHVATATMHDVLDVSEAPVIFSHSSARAVTDVPRNVPDDVLARMSGNGGVVMVTFVPQFINVELAELSRVAGDTPTGSNRPRATMEDVIRHIEHVRDVAGIDHVGLGGDFDGIDDVPVGLEDVSTYPALFTVLAERGWGESDLRKLAGENILRAWGQAEAVAARLQGERGPSTATIEELDGRG